MLKVINSLKSDFIISAVLSVLTSVKYLPTANLTVISDRNHQLPSVSKTNGSNPS